METIGTILVNMLVLVAAAGLCVLLASGWPLIVMYLFALALCARASLAIGLGVCFLLHDTALLDPVGRTLAIIALPANPLIAGVITIRSVSKSAGR